MRRTVDGAEQVFCCYGCCIAYQVLRGHGEESEATWLLIRLGIGGFLSMNVMTFSLVIYSGGFGGMDAGLLPFVHLLLWLLATPVLFLLGGPFFGDTWRQARQGQLGSPALIALAVAASYCYSVVSMLTGSDHVYFDTATMLLVLFTLGRYLEALGRARAIRNLAPLLEAEGQWAHVVDAETEMRVAARDLAPGTLVRVRPGERFPVDGLVEAGESGADESLITGESRPLAKSVRCRGYRRQHQSGRTAGGSRDGRRRRRRAGRRSRAPCARRLGGRARCSARSIGWRAPRFRSSSSSPRRQRSIGGRPSRWTRQ